MIPNEMGSSANAVPGDAGREGPASSPEWKAIDGDGPNRELGEEWDEEDWDEEGEEWSDEPEEWENDENGLEADEEDWLVNEEREDWSLEDAALADWPIEDESSHNDEISEAAGKGPEGMEPGQEDHQPDDSAEE